MIIAQFLSIICQALLVIHGLRVAWVVRYEVACYMDKCWLWSR